MLVDINSQMLYRCCIALSRNPAFLCVACFRAVKQNKSTTAYC